MIKVKLAAAAIVIVEFYVSLAVSVVASIKGDSTRTAAFLGLAWCLNEFKGKLLGENS